VTWRRHARIAVGVVGFGVAAALLLMRRDRPPVAPPPSLGSVDPQSTMESQRGTWVIYRDEKRVGTIAFERIRVYDDGRQIFEQAVLKMEDDDPFEMSAGIAEGRGTQARGELPPEITAKQNVRFTKLSGLHLETDQATFRDKGGVVSMPGQVTFGRDRMSGTGTGANYRRDARTLEVLADANVTVAPDKDGKGALEATAGTMVLNQTEHALHLDKTAVIRMEGRTFEAAKIDLQLTEDEQAVKQVRMLGAARVTPAPGVKNAGPSMVADTIDLVLRPDGRTLQRSTLATGASVGLGADGIRAPWIDMELGADGATVIRLDAKDGVHVDVAAAEDAGARTIDARTLTATGTEQAGLTSARFEGDVKFGEAPSKPGGWPLSATARTLVLALAGGLGAIESAEFLGKASFTDGVVTADAERAIYDARKDRLELRPEAKAGTPRPAIRDARVRMTADSIDLETQTHDVHALGTVETQLLPEQSPKSGSDDALFDRTKPILGTAPEVRYSSTRGRAMYIGLAGTRARVWQDANDVTADRVELDNITQNLSARGRVVTVLEMAPLEAADKAKPEQYRVQSEEADFDQTARRATFKGKPVALSSADRTTEGQTLEIRLAPKTRAVEGFTFAGDVLATLPGGEESLSDRLVYDAKAETYKLIGENGRLVLVKQPSKENGSECVLTRNLTVEVDRRNQSMKYQSAGSRAGDDKIACTTSLRSIRR
jgi:lipopolysaccharide export system protein LptA